ncbi:MAG: LdpA C-terminal domain-containing domain [Crinalium sp.]
MSNLYNPLHSLKEGNWFKLICGASLSYLPAVRNLTLAYTLAGADCIDVAADPAVIAAAREGIKVAGYLAAAAKQRGFGGNNSPWLMVSLNDAEDPHFRKAEFNPANCPADCPRPCEKICPANAIAFQDTGGSISGVIDGRCYGCGRCLPVCPIQQIVTRSYVYTPDAIAPLIIQTGIDAIEIHTAVGHLADFKRLWQAIAPWVDKLKLIAISCGDGEGLIDYLWALYEVMQQEPCNLVWQTDGRPMSGDIGAGTTRAAVKLGEKVLAAKLPGFIQLAGGTNDYTVNKLKESGLLNTNLTSATNGKRFIAGIAYGSYARVLLSPILEKLEHIAIDEADHTASDIDNQQLNSRLEETPQLLWEAVAIAQDLVQELKSSVKGTITHRG